ETVAELLGLFHVVGGEDDRLARPVDRGELLPQAETALRIEPRGRLVEEEDLGPVQQGAGDEHPLRQAAAQLLDARPGLLLQAEVSQQLARSFAALGARQAEVTAMEVEVVEHRQAAVQGVGLGDRGQAGAGQRRLGHDVDAGHQRLAGGGDDARGEHADGGALPRAVGAQEPEQLARLDLEIQPVDGEHFSAVRAAVRTAGRATVPGRGGRCGRRRPTIPGRRPGIPLGQLFTLDRLGHGGRWYASSRVNGHLRSASFTRSGAWRSAPLLRRKRETDRTDRAAHPGTVFGCFSPTSSSFRSPGVEAMTETYGVPRKVLMTADAAGEVWTYSLELARGLGERGVEVALATLGGPLNDLQRNQSERIPGLRVFEACYKPEWLLNLEGRICPDVIHLNDSAHAALPWAAPAVVVGHSCVLSRWQAVRQEPSPEDLERVRSE